MTDSENKGAYMGYPDAPLDKVTYHCDSEYVTHLQKEIDVYENFIVTLCIMIDSDMNIVIPAQDCGLYNHMEHIYNTIRDYKRLKKSSVSSGGK